MYSVRYHDDVGLGHGRPLLAILGRHTASKGRSLGCRYIPGLAWVCQIYCVFFRGGSGGGNHISLGSVDSGLHGTRGLLKRSVPVRFSARLTCIACRHMRVDTTAYYRCCFVVALSPGCVPLGGVVALW